MLVDDAAPVIADSCLAALQIPASGVVLPADCTVPPAARGLVMFIHGSGSNRFSARNRSVAHELQQAGLATLLFDLLPPELPQRPSGRAQATPDLPQLSERVVAVIDALSAIEPLASLPMGLFGSSSGAALAMAAAAHRPDRVRAVVSRGGRPDLVPGLLGEVCCPTLLLVGSHDLDVLELNTWAAAQLRGVHELRVVPGASHLFSEQGTLALVSQWACQWFLQHLLP